MYLARLRYRALAGVLLALAAACAQDEGPADPTAASAASQGPEPAGEAASAPPEALEAPGADDDPFNAPPPEFPVRPSFIGMIDARDAVSLNGQWKAIVDPLGVGNPNSLFGGFPPNRQSVTGMELIEYDFAAAPALRVPGDWNTQDERLLFYRDAVWYFRAFDAEPAPGERAHLHFGGANFETQVFLNGEPVGRHEGGYVPFAFEVTDRLRPGTNELMVRVDAALDDATVPTTRVDWWPYGGLTRDVHLVTTPARFVSNARVWLADREAGVIGFEAFTDGAAPGEAVRVAIPELGVAAAARVDADGHAAGRLRAPGLAIWSPDAPRLYDVEIVLGGDVLRERVGFRTIETRGTQVLLNGEPVWLRGISTHEEPIGVPGVITSRAQARALLQEAKALNANFVRAAHYPYSRHTAQLADEIGLMLWEEVPVYWSIDWRDPETLASAENQLSRLIRRDWNRASVVVWSVANETPYSAARMAFLEALIDAAREMDDTRLVSAALLGGGREEFAAMLEHLAARGLAEEGLSGRDRAILEAVLARSDRAPAADEPFVLEIEDPLGAHTDLVSYNQYLGWYYAALFSQRTGVGEDVLRPLVFDLMADTTIVSPYDKPIFVSEFGAGAVTGRRGGEATIWTEEYQARVYAAQIEMLQRSEQVQGMSPWILKDFRSMLRPLTGTQDYYNRKGLVSPDGQRKLAFDVLREFYERRERDRGGAIDAGGEDVSP